MKVLIFVTKNTGEATKEALRAHLEQTSRLRSATFEAVVVESTDNPSALAQDAHAAYALSEVADILTTSEALADWGRNWRLSKIMDVTTFVYDRPVQLPRRARRTTRRPMSATPKNSSSNNDVRNPRDL